MITFRAILGKYTNPDEILSEAMALVGERTSGELILAIALRKAFERIEALETKVNPLIPSCEKPPQT